MEVTATKPTTVICPACNAQVGHPCTQPTDRSRNPVKFFHYSRIELALEPPTAEVDAVEEILAETKLQPEDFLIEQAAEQQRVESEKILEPEILRHPAELAAELEWQVEVSGSLSFDVHRLCGTVLIPGFRAMHEASCPAVTQGMTAHEREEVRKQRYPTTREENEERQIAWAIARHRRGFSSRPNAKQTLEQATDLLRALGLTPYHVYSEGYAATGERGGATSHGIHWGHTFDDAIARWKAEGGTDAQCLSNAGGRWTYWSCKLFDNLADAQRSFG